jgi:cyanophycinase
MTTPTEPMPAGSDGPGILVVIGGSEEKEHHPDILQHVADRVGDGPLVVMTCATEDPKDAWKRYRRIFEELGVRTVLHLDVRDRRQALDEEASRCLEDARGVFFTGGDQLRITAHLGDTPVYTRLVALIGRGGLVAGTSAGAAVMSEMMVVDGEGDATPAVDEIVRMAPGLGLLQGVVVDMHFSERGRIGRLLGAIAQNPRNVGIGIDEDTAVVVERECLEVIGSGAVYIADASRATHSNVAEGAGGEALTIDDVTLHVLNAGRRFDLGHRRPH